MEGSGQAPWTGRAETSSEAAAVGVPRMYHLFGLHLKNNILVLFILALGELIQKVQLLWKTWEIWPHRAHIPMGSLDHS